MNYVYSLTCCSEEYENQQQRNYEMFHQSSLSSKSIIGIGRQRYAAATYVTLRNDNAVILDATDTE